MGMRGLECVEPEVGELLPLLVEELLPAADARIVEGHLGACARCEEDARDLRDLRRAIGELPPGMGELAAGPVVGPARRSLLVGATTASVLIAVLALGGWWQAYKRSTVGDHVRDLESRLARLEAAQRAVRPVAGPGALPGEGARPDAGLSFPTVGFDFAVPQSF